MQRGETMQRELEWEDLAQPIVVGPDDDDEEAEDDEEGTAEEEITQEP
jgi:hypothetical protein